MTASKSRSTRPKNAPKQESKESVEITRLSASALACFRHIVKRNLLFHTIFIGVGIVALIGFVFFFAFLADSFLMGIFIACFFFAVALYFVLKLYLQEQKPAKFLQLRDEYLLQCSASLGKDNPQALAQVGKNFVGMLEQRSLDPYLLPKSLQILHPHLDKVLATFYWKDLHQFKEFFLRAIIDQQIEQVILNPIDSHVHAELADDYIAIAEHFKSPSSKSEHFFENFQLFAKLAIEELQIVCEYCPDDFLMRMKLAECYLAINLIDKAIEQYEAILQDCPNDQEALYSLGTLYFKQGEHGKALKVYERLKKHVPLKAQELIVLYGTHDSSDFRNISRPLAYKS